MEYIEKYHKQLIIETENKSDGRNCAERCCLSVSLPYVCVLTFRLLHALKDR